MVYDTGGLGILSGDIMGVSALYSYGVWFIVVTG